MLTFEELRKIQNAEKSSAALSELPERFWANATALVAESGARLKENFNIGAAREHDNTLKTLRDIYTRREQKIVLAAARAADSGTAPPGLSPEEKPVFDAVIKALSDGRQRFEQGMAPVKEGTVAVRILVGIPSFVGTDLASYGPFKAGETATLPRKEAALLLRKKIAEELVP